MKTYSVHLVYTVIKEANLEIQAESEEEALEKAEALAPFRDEETERNLDSSDVEEME